MWPAAGTALVSFENVHVPIEYLVGKEGQGFMYVMFNFNHERWVVCAGLCGALRMVIEECFKWGSQRKVRTPESGLRYLPDSTLADSRTLLFFHARYSVR
jgi:alkylation response protein AidB-like acyl-CoA dehydrogenase